MKVKVILETKNEMFSKILPLHFETEIEVVLQERDFKVNRSHRNKDGSISRYEQVIHNKGDYKSYKFKGADGIIYDEKTIHHNLGNTSLEKIFIKSQSKINGEKLFF